jgi:hypothetical protein
MKRQRILIAAGFALLAAGFLYAEGKGGKADTTGTPAAEQNTDTKKANSGSLLKCESGNIKLVLRGDFGTYGIYAVNRNGSQMPVFVDYDNFLSTYFSIRAGKTEYRLNETSGVLSSVAQEGSGGRLLYTIPKTADVSAAFAFMKTSADRDDDMLKVTVTITNREPRTDTFALKGIFDTVLGEKTDIHFSTALTKSVKSEVQYRSMSGEKWILSQGSGCGVQLLLYGGDITPPAFVTLGNKDIMSLPLWVPAAGSARSFDNVMSYNNSAVSVNWDTTDIKPAQSASFIFYIVVSADGDEPAGSTWLASLQGETTQASGESVPRAPGDSVPQVPAPATAAPAAKPKPDVPFDVITEEKLDPEYIRTLINRINALEDDDKSVNREELLKLNTELDAILEKLRQQ